MIKFITLFAVFILSFQKNLGQDVTGGLWLGTNFSQIDGDLRLGYNKVGLSFGGQISYYLKGDWAISPQLIFEQLGSSVSLQQNIFKINQFSFAPLVHLYGSLGKGGKNFFLEAGPNIGALISAVDKNNQAITGLDRFSVNYLLGVGYRLNFTSIHLRFGQSLKTLTKDEVLLASISIGTNNSTGLYHRYFSLGLSWDFFRR
ncbi:MAG: outer membrane beta-barrel protein [Bacteroidota bacterium]